MIVVVRSDEKKHFAAFGLLSSCSLRSHLLDLTPEVCFVEMNSCQPLVEVKVVVELQMLDLVGHVSQYNLLCGTC